MNILLLNAGSMLEEVTRVLGVDGPGDSYHSGTKAVRQ
jgi:hypothetical protein